MIRLHVMISLAEGTSSVRSRELGKLLADAMGTTVLALVADGKVQPGEALVSPLPVIAHGDERRAQERQGGRGRRTKR